VSGRRGDHRSTATLDGLGRQLSGQEANGDPLARDLVFGDRDVAERATAKGRDDAVPVT
jgi:hypothetical protein